MLFRFLLLLLLAYLAFRAARNIWRAMQARNTRPGERIGEETQRGTLPRKNVFEDEVEEARYRDL